MISWKEISLSERIMVIQEYYQMNLRMAAEKYEQFRNQNGLAQVAHQVRVFTVWEVMQIYIYIHFDNKVYTYAWLCTERL